jgi:gluconolactonase
LLYPIEDVQIFAAGLDHPEGLAVASDGTVYAGGEAGQVYRISPDGGKVQIIANTGGFCLGLTLDQQDNIFICDCKRKALLKVTTKGEVSVFVEAVDGVKLNQPNFSVFDSKGNLYFSDSGDWKKTNGVIYRAAPDGTAAVFSPGPFHFANGLALDTAEQHLYVVESNLNRVLRIEIRSDGTAGESEVYAEGLSSVPDGLAFDARGNLYVTTYGSSGIYRVTPDRRVDLLCQDVESELLCLVTNCAFGGTGFDQLLVANLGQQHLSMLDLKVKGQPLWTHRRALNDREV